MIVQSNLFKGSVTGPKKSACYNRVLVISEYIVVLYVKFKHNIYSEYEGFL